MLNSYIKLMITNIEAQMGIYLKEKDYGKCSKISNTLKLRTPKIIAESNF